MAQFRGRRLDQMSRADFEALEERVERAALARHLAHYEDRDDEPPRGWEP